jgi:hypothetical protein
LIKGNFGAMDRQTALDILESVRPGTADESEPEVQAAAEAVRQDRDAAAALARRQEIDCRIAAAMQDIAVPAAAKARLLARMLHTETATTVVAETVRPADAVQETAVAPLPCESADASTPMVSAAPATATSTPPAWRTRRKVLATAIAAATILMLLGMGIFWKQRLSGFGPAITLEQLARSVPASTTEPQQFTGRFVPALPATLGWSGSRLSIASAPQAAFIDDRQAAAYQFMIPVRRNQTVNGWIVVAPANRITDPPPADSFQLASVRYENGLASVAWTEGNLVYVCVVRGGEEALRIVEWALDRRFS